VIAAPFKVVLDANVLFPFSLRDTLLRAAAEGFFQLYWSDEILDETIRNLIATGTTTEAQAARLRDKMTDAFPESMVTGYEPFIETMRNHRKDRHVAAAALKVGAQVIVTCNLRDFRTLPEGLEALSPDDFLSDLLDLNPDRMFELVCEQAKALRRPPRSVGELLAGLAKMTPEFAQGLAKFGGVSLSSPSSAQTSGAAPR